MRFKEAYKKGRKQLTRWGRIIEENYLISLDALIELVPSERETDLGVQDIKVEKIIGTENKAKDFSYGFYPVNLRSRKRWEKIREIMLSGGAMESIEVIEYGGYYFVRDGNHRVSVAKTNGIDYLTASVRQFKIPIKLYPNMTYSKIPLFLEKYNFYKAIPVFDYIPEENFQVNDPDTWIKLKEHILNGHRNWYIKKFKKEPDIETLIFNWNYEIYEPTMLYIKKHSLPWLFPGRLDTDIYIDIMSFWKIMPNKTFIEIYDLFLEKNKNKKRFFSFFIDPLRKIKYKMSPLAIEKDLFYDATRILYLVPDAEIANGSKEWYRFLRRQILIKHYNYIKKIKNENPYIEEVTIDWYNNVYQKILNYYKSSKLNLDFTDFYMKFFKKYQNLIYQDIKRLDDYLVKFK